MTSYPHKPLLQAWQWIDLTMPTPTPQAARSTSGYTNWLGAGRQ